MVFFLWFSKLVAAVKVRKYGEIVSDPDELAQAITESRANGASKHVRAALAREGQQFGDYDRLVAARRDALRYDSSAYVRYGALFGLFVSGAFFLGEGIYPRGIREAMEIGLCDKSQFVRKAARMHLQEHDRVLAKKGFERES